MTSRLRHAYLTLSVCAFLTAPAFAFAAPAAPVGHEVSSGVAVAGGGFITVTAVWVTPGLIDHPYYREWIPQPETRAMHRRGLAGYTLMLLEMANRSRLHVEGYLSVNVRLLLEGQLIRPVRDETLQRQFPELVPEQDVQRIPPGAVYVRVYAFPKVPSGAQSVTFVVRPMWLFEGRRQIGQLSGFELRFDPAKLAFPP